MKQFTITIRKCDLKNAGAFTDHCTCLFATAIKRTLKQVDVKMFLKDVEVGGVGYNAPHAITSSMCKVWDRSGSDFGTYKTELVGQKFTFARKNESQF